jgi:GDP-4-dehydro-6-deoxy-D-mannose reductase
MPISHDIARDCPCSMTPTRILITGAGGFVGRHMLERLALRFPAAELQQIGGDITNAQELDAEIRVLRPQVCIHLAAISAVGEADRDTERAWAVNLHGTLNLASSLRRHAAGSVFLYASTAEAYGASFRSGTPLDETSVLAPLNTYGATKAAADLALGAMGADLHCIRIRAFNHTGTGQSDSFVVASFARQLASIEAGLSSPVLKVGNLEARRDFLDVRDVCAAYATCIERVETLPKNAVMNIASGSARRIGDVLLALLSAAKLSDVSIEQDGGRIRSSDIPFAAGNSAYARKLLNWAPVIAWEQTISDVLQDWRERIGRP